MTRPRLWRHLEATLLPFESAVRRRELEECCEDQTIARCVWALNDSLPDGLAGFGLEFESGARLLIVAAPVRHDDYLARLVWRWWPPQQIWTRSMRRHFGGERRDAGEPEADAVARQIEGERIVGVTLRPAIQLGEQVDLELRDGGAVRLTAIPLLETFDRRGSHGVADLEVERVRVSRARVVVKEG